jgi:hypothetical protein
MTGKGLVDPFPETDSSFPARESSNALETLPKTVHKPMAAFSAERNRISRCQIRNDTEDGF